MIWSYSQKEAGDPSTFDELIYVQITLTPFA